MLSLEIFECVHTNVFLLLREIDLGICEMCVCVNILHVIQTLLASVPMVGDQALQCPGHGIYAARLFLFAWMYTNFLHS